MSSTVRRKGARGAGGVVVEVRLARWPRRARIEPRDLYTVKQLPMLSLARHPLGPPLSPRRTFDRATRLIAAEVSALVSYQSVRTRPAVLIRPQDRYTPQSPNNDRVSVSA
jgi:hypothetical protein